MIRRFREVSRVFLCWDPVDFRKNITGLAGIVQYNFDEDLYSGSLFVFTNRSKNAIKVLKWDTDGFILYHKKRSKGKGPGTRFPKQPCITIHGFLDHHKEVRGICAALPSGTAASA